MSTTFWGYEGCPKITLIVNATPNLDESEALAYYSEYAGAILKAHGGNLYNQKPLKKSRYNKTVESVDVD